MNGVLLQRPVTYWMCPSCGRRHQTTELRVHSSLHECPALGGVIAPFIEVTGEDDPALKSVRHKVIEREDYVGEETGVFHDEHGKAVMAVHTERADGSHDTHVFAPVASLRIG